MEDVLRPSKEAFEYTLRASYQLWSTHINTSDTRLPLECIDLKPLLKDTPAFLAHGLIPSDNTFSFACAKIRGDLEIKGQSRWRTSRAGADCITPPKAIHLGLGCHALEYEGWDWELGDGSRDEDTGVEARFASLLSASAPTSSMPVPASMCVSCPKPGFTSADLPALPKDCEYDLYSDQKSDNPTRGIFCWLRSDGFPANEKGIYQHSWVMVWDDEEEEVDEHESDDSTAGARAERVEDWLGGVGNVGDTEVVVEVKTENCR